MRIKFDEFWSSTKKFYPRKAGNTYAWFSGKYKGSNRCDKKSLDMEISYCRTSCVKDLYVIVRVAKMSYGKLEVLGMGKAVSLYGG